MPIRKVLLADDDADLRRLGKIALEKIGKWHVVLAASGEEAVALAAREQPDVVVMDVSMPRMDGPSALARLREAESTRGIPVIFITARALPEEIAAHRAAGAIGVITKPFNPMTLPRQLMKLLGEARREEGEATILDPIARVQQEFLRAAPSRIADLERALAALRSRPTPDTRSQARTLAHRLHGSAGSHGLMELADIAARIEECLVHEEPTDQESLCLAMDELGRAARRLS